MQRVCEGKTLSIKCDKGVISVVSASYGRQHGKEVCPHDAIGKQDCHAKTSLPTVKEFCEGKASCSVQSTNTHFGDPCGGVYKYLTVEYVCKEGGKRACKTTFSLLYSRTLVDDCNVFVVQLLIRVRRTTGVVTRRASA